MKKLSLLFVLVMIEILSSITITGKVIKVKDGDTIVVLENQIRYTIRLNGIDTPEKSQRYGLEATRFTDGYCFNKIVTVEAMSRDKYGRYIGKVYLDSGGYLNAALVRRGLAWHYTRYNKDKDLSDFEKKAKELKLGLWDDDYPKAPWKYRKDIKFKKKLNTMLQEATDDK